MIPTNAKWLSILRLGLAVSTFGWGISFFFTFAPWSAAVEQLYVMGAEPFSYQPLLDYWLRMASSVFGCIGVVSALAAIWPHRWVSVIQFLAPFHFVIGCTLAVAAWNNHLRWPEHPSFIADITFCFAVSLLTGIPLLQARRTQK